MPAITDPERNVGGAFGHAGCLLCGTENPWSLGLVFEKDGEGGVRTRFAPDVRLQGYDGMLHGGVAAAVLDSAMTNCLFLRGVRAVTGDLRVRYPHPVPLGGILDVRAWVTCVQEPLFRLRAELAQGGRVLVWAQALFCRVPDDYVGSPVSSGLGRRAQSDEEGRDECCCSRC